MMYDSFGLMLILNDNSLLLKKESIKLQQDQREPLKKSKGSNSCIVRIMENVTPTFQIAENIYDSGLLTYRRSSH